MAVPPRLIHNDGHRVVIANLAQYYDAWLQAARAAAALDFIFQWKRVTGNNNAAYEYLYRMTDSGKGLGKSVMRRGPAAQTLFDTHAGLKREWREREAQRYARLTQEARQYRALRLGMISSPAARILQTLDIHGVLGVDYMVVGTNALPAYEIEAGERFAAGIDSTEDFDTAWIGGTLHLSSAQPMRPCAILRARSSCPTMRPCCRCSTLRPRTCWGC